ncbi:hypothetical protein MK851_13625 [Tenacibaculum sp. 1B UA]|uniref:hypothetical protein n=1 Tax=unclassified Tenacibaculum TaxID=2635139 RepID=UPI0026E22D21|nr:MULTISPECIES: hypothetical protein [unclassified Tenacibaculum]MDO6676485.1 hypothetical protein [Tenacibaculum sp. 1_MG-2023]MDX8554657.1 hypothetical protein [Tenacibaculum sp. 1B UA]
MKTKLNYLLVVLCFASIYGQAQKQKNEDYIKKLCNLFPTLHNYTPIHTKS